MWSHVEDGFIWEPGISSRPSQFYFVFLFVVFLLVWKTGVKTSLRSQRGGQRKSSMWSSRIKTALKSQGRSEFHLPSAARASRHLREGPGRMRSLALGACGRAQRTMGGERGLRCRRPLSGLLAAHIPPLFPRRAARVTDAPSHQAFPAVPTAPQAVRSPGGSGGRRGGSPDGGRATARCAQGRPVSSDKDGEPLSASGPAGEDHRHYRPH